MSATTLCLLFVIGLIAFILLSAIQRAERRTEEVASNLQRAGERIAVLERDVASLRKK